MSSFLPITSGGRNLMTVLQPIGYYIAFLAMVLMCDSNASVSTTPTINENVTVQLNNPEIVINDSSGRPCFLGSVNLTIVINYHSETDEGRGRVIRLPMADDVVTRGDCADWNSTPLLSMTWPNGTLQLNLTFHFHKTFVDNNNKTATGKWSLSNVSIHVSDSFFPPGTVGVDAEMSMKHNVTLFVTPMGLSYFCDSPNKVSVGDDRQGAEVNFNMVHLQPFLVKGNTFSEAYVCKDALPVEKTKESYIIPIAVACCLAAIVTGVVIGYAVSRKIHKFRDQSDYKPM